MYLGYSRREGVPGARTRGLIRPHADDGDLK